MEMQRDKELHFVALFYLSSLEGDYQQRSVVTEAKLPSPYITTLPVAAPSKLLSLAYPVDSHIF